MLGYQINRVLWSISWVPVAICINQNIAQLSWVQGSSMQPALNPDSSLGARDLVLVKKHSLKYQVGDVVLLRSPLDPERILIKRIIANGGSVTPRINSGYPKEKTSVALPPNHVWVEGDNIHSIDSNQFGPISKGLIIGKATYILYPMSRWGEIPSHGGRAGPSSEDLYPH